MNEILGSAIHRPVSTRWNSIYDCVKKILKLEPLKLVEAMKALEIPEFTPNDIHFLFEYVKVLKPIASAIDYLQAECHFALFLPIVHNTRQDLIQLKEEKLKFCQPLLNAVLSGMEQRFSYLFDFDDERCKPAIVATCTHPFFKTRWLTGAMRTAENLDKIRKVLIAAAGSVKVKSRAIESEANCPIGNQHFCYMIIYIIFKILFELLN